ncbi:MAG TPA: hypothetical protein VKR24_00750 [Candidatus Limnocylindrales bacterium]|nr:hypothetical protein [Candidatus Limnocylindrales bacterium]
MSDQQTIVEPRPDDPVPALSTADVANATSGQPVDPATATSQDAGPTERAALPASANRAEAAAAPDAGTGLDAEAHRQALFDEHEAGALRDRWNDIQASFVDQPGDAVKQADALVAEVMQRLAQSFAAERSSLEQQWSSGGTVSTEDQRQVLRRYRSFFGRLLAV